METIRPDVIEAIRFNAIAERHELVACYSHPVHLPEHFA